MEVTIAVATYGDLEWGHLAHTRAIPSAQALGVPVVHVHEPDGSIASARNAALELVETEWVIHLDGDDELSPGYNEAMAEGSADVRAPLVRYIRGGHPRPLWQPRVAGHSHDCDASCLRHGNWIVIGAAVRTELLREVGWHDFPWSEDWATWALLAKAGASFELVRNAIYIGHVAPSSRNRGAPQEDRLAAHREIERFVWPEECAA